MKKLHSLLVVIALLHLPGYGQISLTSGTYTQDFNTLALTGTSSTLPSGWLFSESGSNANTTYTAGTGSSTSGETYSFGAGSNSERALGGLQSGSLIPTIGAYFTNNSGSTINTITTTYTGEQWRLGALARVDRLDFQYSLDATSLTTGSWTNVDNLDFTAPVTGPTVGALDGNAAANRTVITFTITGLSITNGSTFYIRWNDLNATGSDDGLSIDDFSLSFTTGSSTTASVAATNNGTEGGANGTFTINLNNPAPAGGTTVSYSLSGSATIGVTNDYTDPGAGSAFILAGATSVVVTMNINDDALFEPTESITLTITNASNVSWSSTPATISLFDNEASQIALYDFNTCTSALPNGFTQYNVTGSAVMGCTTFGRNFTNGVQMNGFVSGSNQLNEDWLISPALDLTATNVPLLAFYSRTTFGGEQLKLYVSTNYVSGDPYAGGVTWTQIDGRFPLEFSDVWTLSEQINLSAFKTSNVHFAFVYNSSTLAASRITLDDIYLLNGSTVPAPTLTTNSKLQDFRFVAFGGSSPNKSFTFWANDLTTNVILTSPANFQLSKDGSTFSSSLTYTPAETQNLLKTVFIRYTPASANETSSGYISYSTTGFTHQRVFLKGDSYPPSSTLNIVAWNIEWFGAAQGPPDNNLQQANVEIVMEYLDADVFALSEIVDEARLASLVSSLGTPGSYSYVIANWCSGGSTTAACASAQKLAFVYKNSVVSNVEARAFLQNSSNPQNLDNWANGRFPMYVKANVTKNGEGRSMYFLVMHAEAGDTQSDYDSRYRGVTEMKDSLNVFYSNANMTILGDFNDDLDWSIYDDNGPTVSSYTNLISDSTDSDSWKSITLPLSHFGLHSHYANGDMIDHMVISNEMFPGYVPFTATLYYDIAILTGIANYELTTSDHYPIMTRFIMASVLPVKLVSFSATKENKTVIVKWMTSQEINSKEFIVERSNDGTLFEPIGIVRASGNSVSPRHYQLTDVSPFNGYNYYKLRAVDNDADFSYSPIARVWFGSGLLISVRPNPADDHLLVSMEGNSGKASLRLTDMSGRLVTHKVAEMIVNQPTRLEIGHLSQGIYVLKVELNGESYLEKIVIK